MTTLLWIVGVMAYVLIGSYITAYWIMKDAEANKMDEGTGRDHQERIPYEWLDDPYADRMYP